MELLGLVVCVLLWCVFDRMQKDYEKEVELSRG